MKEMSNNLSRIIIGKVVEEEFETMKIIFLKNEKELAALEENLQQSYKYKGRNIHLNKVLRYRDCQISSSKEKITKLKAEKENLIAVKRKLEKSLNKISEGLTSSNISENEMMKERKKLYKKVEKTKSQLTTLNVKDVCELQKQCDVLLLKVDNLNAENNELEKLVALLQNDTVVTFADGRYTDEIREVIMELVSLNVSINKVNDVIEVVLHTLSKKDVSKLRLPSDGCHKRIMKVAEAMLHGDCSNAMLQVENYWKLSAW